MVKDDINAKQMFKAYKNKDIQQITDVAKYCIQDCMLVI